jgi:hypothetical protein
MVLAAGRDESTVVNHQAVQNDVQALYRAGAGKIGTVSDALTYNPDWSPSYTNATDG